MCYSRCFQSTRESLRWSLESSLSTEIEPYVSIKTHAGIKRDSIAHPQHFDTQGDTRGRGIVKPPFSSDKAVLASFTRRTHAQPAFRDDSSSQRLPILTVDRQNAAVVQTSRRTTIRRTGERPPSGFACPSDGEPFGVDIIGEYSLPCPPFLRFLRSPCRDNSIQFQTSPTFARAMYEPRTKQPSVS